MKVSLLNFAITFTGLEDQLLGVVVVEEMPEMQEKKNTLGTTWPSTPVRTDGKRCPEHWESPFCGRRSFQDFRRTIPDRLPSPLHILGGVVVHVVQDRNRMRVLSL